MDAIDNTIKRYYNTERERNFRCLSTGGLS